MYIMTSTKRVVAADAAGRLIQVESLSGPGETPVRLDEMAAPGPIAGGPLGGFALIRSDGGVHFRKDDCFLCAEPGAHALVTDRPVPGAWETFHLAPEQAVADALGFHSSAAVELERFAHAVETLLRRSAPVKLFFGCGESPRPGFLNIDIELMATRYAFDHPDEYFIFPFADGPWSLPDDCVDYIFHEDFIEHIGQLQQIQFLAEAWRVMRPGSYHRVSSPNLIKSMRRSDFKAGFRGVYDGEKHWGHIAIFSPASLKEIAELVGYSEVVFTTKNHGVSPFAEADTRPWDDRDPITGNIFADLQK